MKRRLSRDSIAAQMDLANRRRLRSSQSTAGARLIGSGEERDGEGREKRERENTAPE